jgi:hypothetical protein
MSGETGKHRWNKESRFKTAAKSEEGEAMASEDGAGDRSHVWETGQY